MSILSIAEEFSDVPLGRTRDDGDFTGEEFREKLLLPRLKKASADDPLVVVLDGAEGYPSSFLEEAFGGLVRHQYYTPAELRSRMKIEAGAGYRLYADILWEYIDEAGAVSQ